MSKLNFYTLLRSPATPPSKLLSFKPKFSQRQQQTCSFSACTDQQVDVPDICIDVSRFQIQQDLSNQQNDKCCSCEDVLAQILCHSCGYIKYCVVCFEKLHKSSKFAVHQKSCLNGQTKKGTDKFMKIQSMLISNNVFSPRGKKYLAQRNSKQNKEYVRILSDVDKVQQDHNFITNKLQLDIKRSTIEKKHQTIRQNLKIEFEKLKDQIEVLYMSILNQVNEKREEELMSLKIGKILVGKQNNEERMNKRKKSLGNECEQLPDKLVSMIQSQFIELKSLISKISISKLMQKDEQKALKNNFQQGLASQKNTQTLKQSLMFAKKQANNNKKRKKRDSNTTTVTQTQNTKQKNILKVVGLDESNIIKNRNNNEQMRKVKSETILPNQQLVPQAGQKWVKRKKAGLACTFHYF